MLEDMYLRAIRRDPVLLGIYETVIKPCQDGLSASGLVRSLRDRPFENLVNHIAREIGRSRTRCPDLRFVAPATFGFLYDLLRPLHLAVFYKAPLGKGRTMPESFDDRTRYHERVWFGFMPTVIDEIIFFKKLKARVPKEFRRLFRAPCTLKNYFLSRCLDAAKGSLDVETARDFVLSASGEGRPHILDMEAQRRKRLPPSPMMPYFHVAAEIIQWLGLMLEVKDCDKDLANRLYFALDHQLRAMRRFDHQHGYEEDGSYQTFRHRIKADILKRPIGVIRQRLVSNLSRWGESPGIDKCDIIQEVDFAAIKSIDVFDPARTKKPLAYFNCMIDRWAYTQLRKEVVPWRWRKNFRPLAHAENRADELDIFVPVDLRRALQRWLSPRDSDVLVSKSEEEDDVVLSHRYGISLSRVRGIRAQAQRRIRRLHPTPELLILALGL